MTTLLTRLPFFTRRAAVEDVQTQPAALPNAAEVAGAKVDDASVDEAFKALQQNRGQQDGAPWDIWTGD